MVILDIEAQEGKTNPHPISLIQAIYLIFLYESGISQATDAVLLNFFLSDEDCFVTQIFCDEPCCQESHNKGDECNDHVFRPTHVHTSSRPRFSGVMPSGAPMFSPYSCRPACRSMVGSRGAGP